MAYVCSEHGKMEHDWCDECGAILSCDCSNTVRTRFKDLVLDCDDGEKTVTIYIEHCETCGRTFDVSFK